MMIMKSTLTKNPSIQLLRKNQKKRLGYEDDSERVMRMHPFFADVNWQRMERRHYTPPFRPIAGTVNCTINPIYLSHALSQLPLPSCIQPRKWSTADAEIKVPSA